MLKKIPLLHPPGIAMVYFGAVVPGKLPSQDDRYTELNEMGLLTEVRDHLYQDITTEAIRERVLERHETFEARLQAKRSNQTLDTQLV